MHISRQSGLAEQTVSPSPLPGAERVGVRWGIPVRLPAPTSPSHACGAGPSLSPLKGGEGLALRLGRTFIALAAAAVGGDAGSRQEEAGRRLAGLVEDIDRDAAARVPVAGDAQPT